MIPVIAMPQPVFRFAPSPNGELHLGHAYSALVTAETARRFGGRVLLRIENIDLARCRPEFERQIYEDLAWLGFEWEEPVRRQSEHFGAYEQALSKLASRDLLYPCFASRAEIAAEVAARERASRAPWPRDPDGAPLYPGLHRSLSTGQREELQAERGFHALRLDMDRAIRIAGPLGWTEFDMKGRERRVTADPAAWGDVVIRRKNVPTSYHLSVVVDDAVQGVTHVTRGKDLYHATSVHRLLQTLLGVAEPRYMHHELILGGDGEKLAKSRRDTGLRALREAGASRQDVRRMLGF